MNQYFITRTNGTWYEFGPFGADPITPEEAVFAAAAGVLEVTL